jgi:hypothetical protein
LRVALVGAHRNRCGDYSDQQINCERRSHDRNGIRRCGLARPVATAATISSKNKSAIAPVYLACTSDRRF